MILLVLSCLWCLLLRFAVAWLWREDVPGGEVFKVSVELPLRVVLGLATPPTGAYPRFLNLSPPGTLGINRHVHTLTLPLGISHEAASANASALPPASAISPA